MVHAAFLAALGLLVSGGMWGQGKAPEVKKAVGRDCVRERYICFLSFDSMAAGTLLALLVGWPYAGLGRVWGTGSPLSVGHQGVLGKQPLSQPGAEVL